MSSISVDITCGTCYHSGMENEDALLTTKQVAALLNVSVGRVRQWLADGTLASIKPGHDRLIRRRDAQRMRNRKTTPGPKKGSPRATPRQEEA